MSEQLVEVFVATIDDVLKKTKDALEQMKKLNEKMDRLADEVAKLRSTQISDTKLLKDAIDDVAKPLLIMNRINNHFKRRSHALSHFSLTRT